MNKIKLRETKEERCVNRQKKKKKKKKKKRKKNGGGGGGGGGVSSWPSGQSTGLGDTGLWVWTAVQEVYLLHPPPKSQIGVLRV